MRIVNHLKKHKLGYVIGSLGWIFLASYFWYEYLEYGLGFFGHFIRERRFQHVVILLMVPILMIVGYLFEKKSDMERQLKEYSEDLEWKVEKRTRELGERTKELESIMNTVNDAIILLDENHNIIYDNKALERQTGLTSKDAAIAFCEKLTGAKCRGNCTTSDLYKDGKVHTAEITLQDPKSTEEVSLLVTGAPIKDDDGNVVACVESMTNISEMKKLQRELKEYSEQLEQMVEERTNELKNAQSKLIQTEKLATTGKLAASIAHEINNPLCGIRNCIYILMGKIDEDNPNRKYLDMADKEAVRITNIVKRLLDFHRPPKGPIGPININEVIEDILALVEHQLSGNGVAVSKKLDPKLSRVMGSAEQLKQVFLNVILNAQEAMPDGGELLIKTGDVDGSIQIEFTDTGCGIPEDEIGQLFDPFYTAKKDKKGTGLGLSISYGIIKYHNGGISVKSKVGEGSTFTITLPIGGCGKDG